jgi:argininosuccinate lyase
MHDTGLIVRPLLAEARAIVFGGEGEERLRETLHLLAQIDQAHTVMLVEATVIQRSVGRDALRAVRKLIASRFASVIAREPLRGVYMLYESALSEQVPAAADLHVARSRNDINATLFALRCRRSVAELLGEVLRLIQSIDDSIARHGEVGMPVFSHRRPGMPGTWELYLSAVANAVLRDAASLIEVLGYLDSCPLGAGAGAGTEIAIDTTRTAALLGFGSAVTNSLDAVASRDAGLRAVSAAAILASNLSRMAADLMAWYAEHDAIALPDELVGASSVMPQKRNAFLLEHISGKAGRVAGALTASLAACHGAPFANAVQVGTESVVAILDGLSLAKEATTLSALMVNGAKPVPDRFRTISKRGAVGATQALPDNLRNRREPFAAHVLRREPGHFRQLIGNGEDLP